MESEDQSRSDQKRECPTCGSLGTCAPSHRRGFGEDLLGLFAPFLKPFRCSACNWRGFMGAASFVRHQTFNAWLNALVFVLLVSGAFYLVLVLLELAHFGKH